MSNRKRKSRLQRFTGDAEDFIYKHLPKYGSLGRKITRALGTTSQTIIVNHLKQPF